MQTATLLIACDDKPGLVSSFSQFIAANGGNILDADQHTEHETNQFFMRLVFDTAGFALDESACRSALDRLASTIDNMRWDLHMGGDLPKVALFCSRTAHCVYDLLVRHAMGELPGEIALVISNHDDLHEVADHFGIPFKHVPVEKDNKQAAEDQHEALLAEYGIDLVVLARYMQIVGPGFCERWAGRCINIHHSFLPAFVGAKPYHQAFERGVKIIGATAHYVTADLDQGPIIEQDIAHVGHHASVKELTRLGRDVERQVLARAVRWHLERRIIIHNNRTVVFA
ncbi:MAG: formyltetrahydrofolate deformylase [Phycisphaeraceae bacterium]